MSTMLDNIRRAFRSKYAFDVQTTWLEPCLVWLRDQFQLTDLTNNYTLERIYTQWLHTDLTLIADAYCLPDDLDLNAKKVQLSGKYGLQINSVLCISESYYSQVLSIHGEQEDNVRIDTDITETQQWKPPPPKRVFYLELTDGKTILRGLEYETISALDQDTALPGAKILVSGPVTFRRGMLLLTPKNTKVLGGYVEALLEKNSSIESALAPLAKTAANLAESQTRFDRLKWKLQLGSLVRSTTAAIPVTPTGGPSPTSRHAAGSESRPPTDAPSTTPQSRFDVEEDEMDELIRQAYADGVLDDENSMPTDYARPPMPVAPPSRVSTTHNRVSNPPQPAEELILISDDDDSSLPNTCQKIHHFSPPPPPPPLLPPLTISISLPYTYLSLARHQSIPSTTGHCDYSIKGCFSSLVTNPRLVNNEFVLQAYLNDGSDCLLVKLASDILAQRIGVTVNELLTRRRECKNDLDKVKFQTDFNERLKKFGQGMGRLHALMIVRFFADSQMPTVIKIDEI